MRKRSYIGGVRSMIYLGDDRQAAEAIGKATAQELQMALKALRGVPPFLANKDRIKLVEARLKRLQGDALHPIRADAK
jgi:hypothetical protein